ncbi:hypothetical protein FEP55_04018 [Burkholderia multivorans]|nr:hypothetical protein [Burkholderia multivorans]
MLLVDAPIVRRFVAKLGIGVAERLECSHRIAKDEPMLAFAMLEKVVDAPLFPQTLQERPVAFEMLALNVALGPYLVRPRRRQPFIHRKRIDRQHGVRDLDNRHVLEKAAVAILGRMPEPRSQRQRIDDRTPFFANDRRLTDNAGDLAHACADISHSGTTGKARNEMPPAFELNRYGHLRADQRIEIDVRRDARRERECVRRLQFQDVFEQLAYRLAAREPHRRQERLATVHRQRRAGNR